MRRQNRGTRSRSRPPNNMDAAGPPGGIGLSGTASAASAAHSGGGSALTGGDQVRTSDGRRCDTHPSCIVKFRATTTLRDGLRHRAEEYGHRAWPLHVPDPAEFEVQVVASDAGPVHQEWITRDVRDGAPLLAIGETRLCLTYAWGFRVTVVWQRSNACHYVGVVEIEKNEREGDGR